MIGSVHKHVMFGILLFLVSILLLTGSAGSAERPALSDPLAVDLPLPVDFIPVGIRPVGVAVDPALALAVVANRDSNTLTLVDLPSQEIFATILVNTSPTGVAVNTLTDIAVVTERDNNTISFIDLAAGLSLGSIDVALAPTAVAIHESSNLAIVVNSGSNTVSIISLDTQTVIAEVPVGSNPRGVDVDQATGIALVTNRDSNTLSLVDMNDPREVATIPVPTAPEGVAIRPNTRRALVTTRNADGTGQVKVVDLDTRTVVATIAVGNNPTSIAIVAVSSLAVVADTDSNDLRVLDLSQNPPVVSFTIPLAFEPLGAAVYPAGNQALITIRLADPAEPGLLAVVRLPSPAPVVTSLNPLNGRRLAGSPQFTLTVNGSNFFNRSVVRFDGLPLDTTFVGSEQLTAIVPETLIAEAKTARIDVRTPAPGGGTSNSVSFEITNPQPALTAISPAETYLGNGLIVTVDGSGFLGARRGDSVVRLAGTQLRRTRVSLTQLRILIPSTLVAQSGSYALAVTNPPPDGGISNSLNFTVRTDNPAPAISSIFPDAKVAGDGAFVLMVNGSNFVNRPGAASSVRFGGTSLTTTFVNRSLLTVTVPANLIASTGTVPVTVFNPAPGGGTSNAISIAVNNPAPALSSLAPAAVAQSSPPTSITMNGGPFIGGTSGTIAKFNGSARPTTFINSRQLQVQLTAADLANPGLFTLTATNPLPGGKTSNPLGLTVFASGFRAAPVAFPLLGAAPLTVRFIPNGFDSGGTITLYRWDFLGTGSFQTSDEVAQVRTFTYTDPGVYNAALEVVNNRGQRARAVVTITVLPPGVMASAVPSNGGAPLPVTFTVTPPSGVRVSRYEWDFEGRGMVDYTSTTTGNTTYTYQRMGTFLALLRMTTVTGSVVTQTVTVRVGVPGTPTALAQASANSGNTPFSVTFNGANSSSPPGTRIVRYEWDFVGDATFPFSSDRVSLAPFTYRTPGAYQATLRVTNDLGISSIDQVMITANLGVSLSILQDTLSTAQGQTTTIRTTLSSPTVVSVRVADQFGGVLRNLITSVTRPAGTFNDVWDGKDNSGRFVAEGAYFAILEYSVLGQTQLLDLTAATGYGRFNPSRTYIPPSYNPFANVFVPINLTLSQATYVDVFVGLFNTNTRFVTLLNRQPLGRGTYSFIWDGIGPDGRIAIPPPGSGGFLLGTFGYTLPSNGVVVVAGGPQITGASATPNFFDPTARLTLTSANPTVSISYNLTRPATVTTKVINMDTQRVLRTITQANVPAGRNQAIWNGRDDADTLVINGDYRMAIQASDAAGNRSIQLNVVVRVFY